MPKKSTKKTPHLAVVGEVLPSASDQGAKHSKIGASSMHRWAACPGSVKLCEGLESKSSSYAEEGTKAHELAAYRLTTGVFDRDAPPHTEEMLEAVTVYAEYVEELRKAPLSELFVEQKFDLSNFHPGLFGTADAVVYDAPRKILHVVDFKYGQGIAVEVEANEQLMYYGLGALSLLKKPCVKVVLHIVQPRCPHAGGVCRSWETDAITLTDFAADLIEAAKATEDPFAPVKPGDHCRFCPAAAICPEIAKKATTLAKIEFGNASLTTREGTKPIYDPKQLAAVLGWLPVLEGWAKNVRDFAYGEAEHGREIPGWKLVAKRATRKWADEVKIGQFLDSTFPQMTREFYETSLKSPAGIEKILHASKHEIIEPFVVSVSSGNTLVPESDKRPAVKVITAQQEFNPIEDGFDLFT